MQPEIQLTASTDGNSLLVLRGEEGAVTVEAWWHDGEPIGVLVIHSLVPMREGQPHDKCHVLGRCYMDVSYADGFKAADLLLEERYEEAAQIALAHYSARLAPEGARS
jgi:hypothetical protein